MWTKRDNEKFDVTMGSYDGAELCETVGLYLLNQLQEAIDKEYMGLYRDDGLTVVELSGPEINKLRKKVTKLSQDNDLKITIESNIKIQWFIGGKKNVMKVIMLRG